MEGGDARRLGDVLGLREKPRSLLGGGEQLPVDCNQDGALNIADAVCIFEVLFLAERTDFPCGDGSPGHEANLALFDWQPDGSVNLSDGIRALQHLVLGGPPHTMGSECVTTSDCAMTCLSR